MGVLCWAWAWAWPDRSCQGLRIDPGNAWNGQNVDDRARSDRSLGSKSHGVADVLHKLRRRQHSPQTEEIGKWVSGK